MNHIMDLAQKEPFLESRDSTGPLTYGIFMRIAMERKILSGLHSESLRKAEGQGHKVVTYVKGGNPN